MSPAPDDSTLMPGSHGHTAICLQVCSAGPSQHIRLVCPWVLESQPSQGNLSIAIFGKYSAQALAASDAALCMKVAAERGLPEFACP